MDGWIKIGTEIDTKSFDKQVKEIENTINKLEEHKAELLEFPIPGEDKELKKTNQQLDEARRKLQELYDAEKKVQKATENNEIVSQNALKGIGNGVEGVIKKIGKWALAIFGVRSAYMLIRRSMSTLSQYDDNLSSQLNYISWTIANAIAPIVNWILNMVYLILQYVNQIIESLFGFRLFKGPQEFAKSMKSASGSAKEIQKALAGFDEKNILSTGASSGGGGSNFTMPQFKDVSDAPKWMQWLFKNGKTLKLILEGIATAILTIKNNLTLLQGVGLFLALDGIANTIRDIKDYLDAPTWEKFNNILIDIGETLSGIFLLFKGGQLGTLSGVLLIIVGAIWSISNALKKTKDYLNSPTWRSFLDMLNGATTLLGPLGILIAVLIGLFREFKDEIKGATTKLKEFYNEAKNLYPSATPTGVVASGLGGKLASWIKGKFNFASGGIINNPGRGVPLTNAVGGEQSAEGIIPLNNAQVMTQLGESIAKYITINLTNITELDGNTIARKVNQIQNNNNFVRNR